MTCPTCREPTNRLIFDAAGTACANCRGLSEAGGVRISGLLTRSSDRVREQQRRFEGDTITAHIYDFASKKMIPNPDFIKRYPDRLDNFFKQPELEQAGYTKVDSFYKAKAEDKAKVEAAKDQVTFKKGKPKGIKWT